VCRPVRYLFVQWPVFLPAASCLYPLLGMAPAGSEGNVSACVFASATREKILIKNCSLFKPALNGWIEPVRAMGFTPWEPTLRPQTWVPVSYTTTLSKIDEHITRKLNHLISTCITANT